VPARSLHPPAPHRTARTARTAPHRSIASHRITAPPLLPTAPEPQPQRYTLTRHAAALHSTQHTAHPQSPWASSRSSKPVRRPQAGGAAAANRDGRPRALPPRAALHPPREALDLHQRSPLRRRRVRLHRVALVLDKVGRNHHQHQLPPLQQDALHDRRARQRARPCRHWPLVKP
jgi:hypothetical protein